MLEKQLILSIVKHLPKTIHHQSMTFGSMSQNGTPDRYFDGPDGDLWIEFKQLKSMPRSGIAIGNYSALQLRWMERRYANGNNVLGIVGLPDRNACIQRTPDVWKYGTEVISAVSCINVAAYIISRLT